VPIIPPVAKGRAPKRSERIPDTGPAIRNPAVSGSMAMPAINGVRENEYPCSGNQIPWSQMMSMNMSPPRLNAANKLAKTPALKARILKSCSRNIGSATLVSMMQNAIRRATPMMRAPRTFGLVHPMVWDP
jgi:hypothetical protein